ncbi:zeta toxin family protein [Vibrio alginolyticus]|nr:zeta toxin family protein [Vibrio alginolyticus]
MLNKFWQVFQKKESQESSASVVLEQGRIDTVDNAEYDSDAFDEILVMEKLLKKVGFKNGCWETQVLAREICLIDRIAAGYDFNAWYESDKARHALRAQIARELVTQKIPENDDDIRIGLGGCVPRVDKRSDRQAIIILGLPASGKSGVAQKMSDNMGAHIIDSDFAKRKFPEIAFPNGAGWTHEESNNVVFNSEGGPLAACLGFGYNMIIPKIGSEYETILELKEFLESMKYKVSLGLVWLAPEKALLRAINRYKDTKRYIPMSVIEKYEDKPLKVYKKLVTEQKWESYLHLSSDVDKGMPCEVVNISSDCEWWLSDTI